MTTSKLTFIGIDPGKTGAIAVIPPDPGPPEVYDMPLTPEGLDFLMLEIRDCAPGTRFSATIERAQSAPGMGVSSAFNYGRHYGSLIQCLTSWGFPYLEVQASVWKRSFNLPGGSSSQTKDLSRMRAMELLPHSIHSQLTRKKDHNRAEALLIALYGKRN